MALCLCPGGRGGRSAAPCLADLGGRIDSPVSARGQLLEVRPNPHLERRIECLEISDRDRPQLPLVTCPEEVWIEGHCSGQVRNVLAIDRAVSAELREGQVVGVERKECEMLALSRKSVVNLSSYDSGRLATVTCWK